MIIAVVAVVMGTALSLTKLILGYLRERRQEGLPSGEGVRTSELRQLMVEAVAAANAPLRERIERLEARFDGAPLPLVPAPTDEETRTPAEIAAPSPSRDARLR